MTFQMFSDNYRETAISNILSKNRNRCDMDEILPNLYLGGFAAARNTELLLEYKIKHVVCCLQWLNPNNYGEDINVIQFELNDAIEERISVHFEKAIEFIHAARSKGEGVLVHCFAGVSRSATIIAAYLMTVTQLGLGSLGFLTVKRRASNPNSGFRLQLSKYYSEGKVEEQRQKLKVLVGEEAFERLFESDLNATKMDDLRRNSISAE